MLLPASLRDGALGLLALGLGGLFAANLPAALAADTASVATAPAPSPPASAPTAASPTPLSPPARPGAPSSITPDNPPRVASYTLSARLDAEKHEIAGKGTIVFKAGELPVDSLDLHLYLNAFKNEKSVFLRSPFGEGRGGGRALDWGYIDVKRLVARELGGVDLWPLREPHGFHENGTRDDDDETAVHFRLPRALAPGETLTLEVEWLSKLPRVVLRTGYEGDFHFAGQWFPKLAKRGGFAFHPQAEFYADFGDYDVTLDVPAGAVVGATGERVDSRASGGRRIERYRASAVHDFAWTAWPQFRERSARIDGVAVRLLYPPGHERNAQATLDTLSHALPHASSHYGRYPYPTLTVVHPPERAAEAGGMEYPTLITTGTPWYAGLLGDRALEALVVHELMHQWFYGIVATDEYKLPVLDEGLASYTELRALEARFGTGSAFRGFGLEISAPTIARLLSAERAQDVRLSRNAADFPGFRSLAALVYSRTATLLATLGRVYGEHKLGRAFAVYTARYRFRHPTLRDFIQVVEEEMGTEAATALHTGITDHGHVDYVVRDLENARERAPGGIFDGAEGRETRTTLPPAEPMFRGRAVVFRHGNLDFPIDIELIGADGSRQREHWRVGSEFHVVEWRGRAPLAYVIADPEHRVLVDDDLMNNALAVTAPVPRHALERASYVAGLLFAGVGP
jgi:hypothetical protein